MSDFGLKINVSVALEPDVAVEVLGRIRDLAAYASFHDEKDMRERLGEILLQAETALGKVRCARVE